jgi:hypothetical protein
MHHYGDFGDMFVAVERGNGMFQHGLVPEHQELLGFGRAKAFADASGQNYYDIGSHIL